MCRQVFVQAVDYAAHVRVHPLKCSRCKEWFASVELYLAHVCRRLAHDH